MPPAPHLAAREGTGGENARWSMGVASKARPHDRQANARSFSPFEHRREGRKIDMQDGGRSAPAFSGQKFADACHSRRPEDWLGIGVQRRQRVPNSRTKSDNPGSL